MQVKTDFHIHTKHVGCADNTMDIRDIVRTCEQLGLKEIAITDHLNRLDQLETHKRIKQEILTLDTEMTIYFGAELNFSGDDGHFAVDEDYDDDVGFQFFIGGIHSAYGPNRSPYDILRTQHQHHLKTCKHPMVSVLVHPYWFPEKDYTAMPWLSDLSELPKDWVIELGQTAVETNTGIEINAAAILECSYYPASFKRSYLQFLKLLKQCGVKFSLGTDAHSIGQLSWIRSVERVVTELQLSDSQIWRPDFFDIRSSN